jgi:hypothetical protein
MLYWICPECGHECSPAIRECPTCTAPPESTPNAGQQLLSLAQNFQSTGSTGPVTAGMSSAAATAVAIEDLPKVEELPKVEDLPKRADPPREPELSDRLAPLDNIALKPARPTRLEALQLSPAPVPVRISPPAVARAAAPTRAESVLEPAGSAPAAKISFQAARGGESEALGQAAQPLPSRRQSVAFVRAELTLPHHNGISVANLAPMSEPALKPVVLYQPNDGVSMPLAYQSLAYKTNEPSLVSSSHLNLSGEPLADLLHALQTSAEEFERVAIHAIHSAFAKPPAVNLLPAPAEVITAPAPPTGQWMRSQKPRLRAVAPVDREHAAVFAGPQAPPLAGPSLPPQLLNFDHQNSSLRSHRRRMPAWPISLLLATIVILGVVSLLQYFTQDHDAKAVSVAPLVQAAKALSAPALHVPVVQEHPAARSVEVAGVRIVMGPNKKPQLQYIVINHSSSELTGLNIRIAVRSVDGLADAPLFSVSSVVAVLGPNQSKEIRTDLNSSVQPSAIPDWQSLRTEILIGRQ